MNKKTSKELEAFVDSPTWDPCRADLKGAIRINKLVEDKVFDLNISTNGVLDVFVDVFPCGTAVTYDPHAFD
jgi:hypothetical protein